MFTRLPPNKENTTLRVAEAKLNAAPKIRQLSIPNFTMRSNMSQPLRNKEVNYEITNKLDSSFQNVTFTGEFTFDFSRPSKQEIILFSKLYFRLTRRR